MRTFLAVLFFGVIFEITVYGQIYTNEVKVIDTGGNVGIGTQTPSYKLTLGGNGSILGIDNGATFLAKNSGGSYETYLWPRWTDDIMYLNFGSGGFNIRNNSSSSSMFINNSGNVGIGTITPSYKLDVQGSILASELHINGYRQWFDSNSTPDRDIYQDYLEDDDDIRVYFRTYQSMGTYAGTYTYPITIIRPANSNASYVGIGTSTPSSSYRLHVAGSIGATSFNQTSDLRLKNIFGTILGLDIIKKFQMLNLYLYTFKEDDQEKETKKEHIGVIAQEVEKVFPEFVTTDDKGIKSVDYPSLAVTAIAAINEQHKEINKNKEDIKHLTQLMQQLTERISQFEKNK